MVKSLMRIVIIFGFIEMAIGGVCWVKIMEGKCKEPIQRNISKENCCSAGPNVGFTEKDLNDFEYFFATAIGDGSSCTSCLESCKTAKCGTGKKCIQRNDQPKCVCAPNCKAIHSKRTSRFIQKENENEKIRVVEGLMKKRKRISKRLHVINKDVDFVNSTNNSSKFRKSERVILSDSKVLNRIHGDNKKRTNVNKSIKNEYVKGNYSSVVNDSSRHKGRNNFKQQSKWPSMIRTGGYGYDVPFPSNQFSDEDHGVHFKPVCGTDGRTYKTECQLKKRACRQEISNLQVAYKGQCQSFALECYTCEPVDTYCENPGTIKCGDLEVCYEISITSCKNVKCPHSMHCLEDQNLMPHCVSCAMKCPPFENTLKSVVSNPSRLVCGTDGITYRNLCEIKRAACTLGRSIPVAYRGPCNDTANCNNIKCKDRQICLNDLITHRPRCVSCNFKCSRKRKPQGKRNGKLSSFGAHTEMKLCGRNNHTYHSWCQMLKDSCNTGFFIDIEHNGECSISASNSTTTLSLGVGS